MKSATLPGLLALTLLAGHRSPACTSILVTKGASRSGAVMITYSCDGPFHPRPRIVPAADHPPGERVEVQNEHGLKGSIPEAARTFKVVGLMNEHQLAIGETTFDGRLELVNRQGLLSYFTLIRLTLQRARTAREAIGVLTGLAAEHGYASTGESFSIADKEEAWILEMIGAGEGRRAPVWAAVRVPDGMVAAHANMARIDGFPLDDPASALYSPDVISFAVERGYFDPAAGRPFSFSRAYNPPTEEQVRYSGRRIWSIFRRVAPSLRLAPDYGSGRPGAEPYPLWIRPDAPLSLPELIALHRDHYEGTPFDMTRDLTAGPFGAPDRWRPLKWEVEGRLYAWERPIATQQAGFVHATESRAHMPDAVGGVYWYGLDNPYTNFFIPLYTAVTALPPSWTRGTIARFSRDSAWWAFNFVAGYANLRWRHMIADIQAAQREIEELQFAVQPALEEAAVALLRRDPALVPRFLTKWCVDNAEGNLARWWELADTLVTKYNDGYIRGEDGALREEGYPEAWLRLEAAREPERLRLRQERAGKGEL